MPGDGCSGPVAAVVTVGEPVMAAVQVDGPVEWEEARKIDEKVSILFGSAAGIKLCKPHQTRIDRPDGSGGDMKRCIFVSRVIDIASKAELATVRVESQDVQQGDLKIIVSQPGAREKTATKELTIAELVKQPGAPEMAEMAITVSGQPYGTFRRPTNDNSQFGQLEYAPARGGGGLKFQGRQVKKNRWGIPCFVLPPLILILGGAHTASPHLVLRIAMILCGIMTLVAVIGVTRGRSITYRVASLDGSISYPPVRSRTPFVLRNHNPNAIADDNAKTICLSQAPFSSLEGRLRFDALLLTAGMHAGEMMADDYFPLGDGWSGGMA